MRIGSPAWRATIRIARRDALRRGSRGRTALIAAMIGLPVAVICGASVLATTTDVSDREALDTALGLAVAQVVPIAVRPVHQLPNLDAAQPTDYSEVTPEQLATWTPQAIAEKTGGRLIPWMKGETTVTVPNGKARVGTLETQLGDPVAGAAIRVIKGRTPRSAGEVAVSMRLRERGPTVGSTVRVGTDQRPFTVVGVVADRNQAELFGLPGAFDGLLVDAGQEMNYIPYPTAYLVDRAEPVTWGEVLRLNQSGLGILSREVVENPPPDSQVSPEARESVNSSYDAQMQALIVIVATAIIVEVTLLAGPAFAVGVRRQRRVLALIGAGGGTPRQVARVVRAQALVIGLGSALLGALLGVCGVSAFVWTVQNGDPYAIGPLDIAWLQVAATVALGAGAALFAAWFPSRQAARTDVVLELTGRRPIARHSWGHPLVAAVLLGAGAVLARPSHRYSEFWGVRVSIATIVLVVGGIVAMPTLLSLVARLSRRLPLPVRLAARDADRHRSRSTPAAAAIMATVAALTALGIASFSDQAESEATYRPQAALGQTEIEGGAIDDDAVWSQLQQRASQVVAAARLAPLGHLTGRDVAGGAGMDGTSVYLPTEHCPALPPQTASEADLACANAWGWPEASDQVIRRAEELTGGFSMSVGLNGGSSTVGDPDALAASGWTLTAPQRAMLDGGGILVPRAESIGRDGMTTLTITTADPEADPSAADPSAAATITVRARAAVAPASIRVSDIESPGVVITPRTAADLGLDWNRDAAMVLGTPLTDDQSLALGESLTAVTDQVYVHTERGFAGSEQDTRDLLLLILAGAGGLLVLVGTFTATGLAMADAKADLSTLSAVGASPALRRSYSAAQALVIAVLGATVGVALGFAPGIAATWPLTAEGTGTQPYLDIPWALLGILVVIVPAFAALVAAVVTRSKLPVVRRLAQ